MALLFCGRMYAAPGKTEGSRFLGYYSHTYVGSYSDKAAWVGHYRVDSQPQRMSGVLVIRRNIQVAGEVAVCSELS